MKFTHLIKRENLALSDLFVYFVSAPRRVISKQAPFSLAWKETRDIRGLANHEKHFSRAKTQQLYFSMIFFKEILMKIYYLFNIFIQVSLDSFDNATNQISVRQKKGKWVVGALGHPRVKQASLDRE